MKKQYALPLVPLLLSALLPLNAQTVIVNRDPQIADMVAQISADSLRAHINGLVSFGTRHTLSTTTDKSRGTGAARQWILGKFNHYAKQAGGRLTAKIDTWTLQADGRRIDKSAELANVMATLKGTDPTDDRIFIVQGHMDSRVTNVMNRESDAPGANDDGSGTAAVIELCRVMSKTQFPATIIFVTLTGEEQGLLGAEHLSQRAVNEKWNLEAVLNNDIMGSNNSNETNIIDNTRLRVFSEGLSGSLLKDTTGRIAQIRQLRTGERRQAPHPGPLRKGTRRTLRR